MSIVKLIKLGLALEYIIVSIPLKAILYSNYLPYQSAGLHSQQLNMPVWHTDHLKVVVFGAYWQARFLCETQEFYQVLK